MATRMIEKAWTRSVESDESDSLVMIEANVTNHDRPTMLIGVYDSDQIEIDVNIFTGKSVGQVHNILQKKVGKYFKLMDLLKNIGE